MAKWLIQCLKTKRKLRQEKKPIYRKLTIISLSVLVVALPAGCRKEDRENNTLLVAAAASLEHVMKELQVLYEEQNPDISLTFTFAGSGSLEQQIRQGAPVDIFLSAAEQQMNSLAAEDLLLEGTRIDLLENQVALILNKDSDLTMDSFEDINMAAVIALGDPESVPAGAYAKEILEGLKLMDEVKTKVTYGKDVTEILAWVSSGNAEAGVVYTTDAALSSEIRIAAIAPEGSHRKVIYPAAVIDGCRNEMAARDFIGFLITEQAKEIFIEYGFEPIE